jgi:cytochrome c oxidase cbb3-type subunit 2
MERFEGIFIAAIVIFALAFVLSGVLPVVALNKVNNTYQDWQDLSANLSRETQPEFYDLTERYPDSFQKHYPTNFSDQAAVRKTYETMLRDGRDAYIAESCWHCHSQYIRPVSKEKERWGAVSEPEEYNNALSMPQLWGTRRVGPDLSREKGIKSNDWHMAHLWDPRSTVPWSVMPRYRWFFDAEGVPGKRALAVVTYLQWLGTTRDQVREHGLPKAADTNLEGSFK